jgi:hypothetical protein
MPEMNNSAFWKVIPLPKRKKTITIVTARQGRGMGALAIPGGFALTEKVDWCLGSVHILQWSP